MALKDDIRTPGYFENNPLAMNAFRFVCDLTPENFMRFVRMAVELREAVDQKAIAHASTHYRNSRPTEDGQ